MMANTSDKKSENFNLDKLSKSADKPADFETAITATGFGKFNIILILISIPAGWSSIFETTTMSYVFPAAQCDLNLDLATKGFLNAITYIGMISGAFIWGYLCDTFGRKKLISAGLFLDGLSVILSASAQNVTVLIVAKFLGGFLINGPFAALTTYLSEFHCAKHRARVQMTLGIIFSVGNVCLPLLAWGVLPLNLDFKVFNETFEFHSWNLFLLLSAIPPIIGSIAFIFMPESPKFLMTCGKFEKALEVFQKVYTLNTGQPLETFPVNELMDDSAQSTPKNQKLMKGLNQIKPLFFKPYLSKILLVCFMQHLIMMSLNTLRLWLPQIFQAINDYEFYHNGTTASLCMMLEEIKPSNSSIGCTVNMNNSSVYINSIIVAVVTIVGYVLTSIFINKFGKKNLLIVLGVLSGISSMTIYFSQTTVVTIILSSLFIALGSICVNLVIAVVVDIFPTTLRTMTVSLTMMIGRCGAMLGNLVFPLLLQMGCAPPFFSVGTVIIICAFFSCLLPNTDLKALQ